MSEVLVLVDHVDGAIKKVTCELLTAARALGEPAAVVVGAARHRGEARRGARGLRRREGVRGRVRRRGGLPDHPAGRRPGRAGRAGVARRGAARRRPSRPGGRRPAGRATGSGLLADAVDVDGRARIATQSVFGGAYHRAGHGRPRAPGHLGARRASIEAEPAPGRGAAGSSVDVGGRPRAKSATVAEPRADRRRRPPRPDRGVGRRLRRPRRRLGRELRGRRGARRRARAARSAPRAPRSTPATTRTSSRSARPARPSRRSSTSRSASPARSSTGPACRPRRRSSRSTRTPRRRSSRSPTSAWWATCSRSRPQLTEAVKASARARRARIS